MTTNKRLQRYASVAAVLSLTLAACGGDDGDDGDADDAEEVDDAADADTGDSDDDAAEEEASEEEASEEEASGEEAAEEEAPAAEAADAEPVTLSYFTFSAAPDHLEDLDAIIAAFNEEHPNITIDVQTAAYADYFTSLQTQIAGGTAPDTFELNFENFVTYGRSGALLELDPYLGADGIDPARYYPLALDGFNLDGTQYGLPATFSDVVLFYNKTMFDEAGLDYPAADWTWADAQAAAETLTDADNGVYGMFQPVSFFEFYKTLGQAGGTFFSEDGTAAFNSSEGVRAAEWLVGKPGTIMPPFADVNGIPDVDSNLFTSGKLGMLTTGIWMISSFNESGIDYDIVVEPGDAQKSNAVFMNGAVASAGTDHPEAAAAWIAFLTGSQETVDVRLASSWELPAVDDEAAFATYLEQPQPENREAVFNALDHIALPPVIERQAEMQDIVGRALESIIVEGVPAQEALDAAAAEVDSISG